MKAKIRELIAKYPYIATSASAVAGYYGGPQGAELLHKAAVLFGLV